MPLRVLDKIRDTTVDKKRFFIDDILDDNPRYIMDDSEIFKLLRAATNSDKAAPPLLW